MSVCKQKPRLNPNSIDPEAILKSPKSVQSVQKPSTKKKIRMISSLLVSFNYTILHSSYLAVGLRPSDSLIIMVAHPGMCFFGLKRSTQRRPVFCFANVLSMPTCSSIYYTKCLKPCFPHSQAAKSLACLPARLCLPDS